MYRIENRIQSKLRVSIGYDKTLDPDLFSIPQHRTIEHFTIDDKSDPNGYNKKMVIMLFT